MNENRAGFDQHSGIEIEIAYVKYGGSAFDHDIICKPTGEFIGTLRAVRDQTVHVGRTDVLFVQIVHGDFRIVTEDHAGNDFIAEVKSFARAVFQHVLAHLDDFARSFVTENDGNIVERIVLEFVSVRTADAASFYFYKNIVVADLGKRIFLKFESAFFDKHGNSRLLRDRGRARSLSRGSGRSFTSLHVL